jgi:hypothetical protein
MDEKPMVTNQDREPNAIEGADAAALGTAPPPESAPPGAAVDGADRLADLPAADAAVPPTEARPWSTSLAARGTDAGVMSDEDVTDTRDPAFDDTDRH